jgi:hypothetical protein
MVVDFIIFYLLLGNRISTEYLHLGLSFAIYVFQTSFCTDIPSSNRNAFVCF